MKGSAVIAARYELHREDFRLEVEIEIPMHGITGVFGESGAGKTTLLRCIAGLEPDVRGRLAVAGDVWQDGARARDVHEREVGYVFQEPRLFPHLDVRGNILYGRRRTNSRNIDFDTAIDLLGLAGFLDRRIDTLSGGEAQRVAIARALLRAPRFVLMDEPLAALDRTRREEILPFLDRLHTELAVPIIYVSHSVDEVTRLCDYLLVMSGGRIVASGSLQQVLLRSDVPILGGEEAGAVIQVRVTAMDGEFGLTRVISGDSEMWVPGRYDPGSELRLRIRANDVSICRERPAATTIMNILPATVESIREDGEATELVQLATGGASILARITRRSRLQLGLRPGEAVLAQIKSVAVKKAPASRG